MNNCKPTFAPPWILALWIHNAAHFWLPMFAEKPAVSLRVASLCVVCRFFLVAFKTLSLWELLTMTVCLGVRLLWHIFFRTLRALWIWMTSSFPRLREFCSCYLFKLAFCPFLCLFSSFSVSSLSLISFWGPRMWLLICLMVFHKYLKIFLVVKDLPPLPKIPPLHTNKTSSSRTEKAGPKEKELWWDRYWNAGGSVALRGRHTSGVAFQLCKSGKKVHGSLESPIPHFKMLLPN